MRFQVRNMRETIAIDFDGTIVTHRYPDIGDLKDGVKEAINALYDRYEIVIWTCRNNHLLNNNTVAAIKRVSDYLDANGIKYDRVDDGKAGKVLADYYIDDRAIEFKDNWAEIEQRLK